MLHLLIQVSKLLKMRLGRVNLFRGLTVELCRWPVFMILLAVLIDEPDAK